MIVVVAVDSIVSMFGCSLILASVTAAVSVTADVDTVSIDVVVAIVGLMNFPSIVIGGVEIAFEFGSSSTRIVNHDQDAKHTNLVSNRECASYISIRRKC